MRVAKKRSHRVLLWRIVRSGSGCERTQVGLHATAGYRIPLPDLCLSWRWNRPPWDFGAAPSGTFTVPTASRGPFLSSSTQRCRVLLNYWMRPSRCWTSLAHQLLPLPQSRRKDPAPRPSSPSARPNLSQAQRLVRDDRRPVHSATLKSMHYFASAHACTHIVPVTVQSCEI